MLTMDTGLLVWLHTECGQLKMSRSSSRLPTRYGVGTCSLSVYPSTARTVALYTPKMFWLQTNRTRGLRADGGNGGSPGENFTGSRTKKGTRQVGVRHQKCQRCEGRAGQTTARLYELIKSTLASQSLSGPGQWWPKNPILPYSRCYMDTLHRQASIPPTNEESTPFGGCFNSAKEECAQRRKSVIKLGPEKTALLWCHSLY